MCAPIPIALRSQSADAPRERSCPPTSGAQSSPFPAEKHMIHFCTTILCFLDDLFSLSSSSFIPFQYTGLTHYIPRQKSLVALWYRTTIYGWDFAGWVTKYRCNNDYINIAMKYLIISFINNYTSCDPRNAPIIVINLQVVPFKKSQSILQIWKQRFITKLSTPFRDHKGICFSFVYNYLCPCR